MRQVTEQIEQDLKQKNKKRTHNEMLDHAYQGGPSQTVAHEMQAMKDDGSMTDDGQTLKPSNKRMRYDNMSCYTMDYELISDA